jgi:type IV pilus assembly protein PilA
MIEMMAVLTVLAILAVMAAPSYLSKFVRDQVAEALPLADIVKTPVAASWTGTQSFPADNAVAGLPTADKIVNNFISSVSVEDGAIHITFGNRANGSLKGKILTLRPAVVSDAPIVPVTWVCGYAAAPDKMTIQGRNKTNVPMSYLPSKCRSG